MQKYSSFVGSLYPGCSVWDKTRQPTLWTVENRDRWHKKALHPQALYLGTRAIKASWYHPCSPLPSREKASTSTAWKIHVYTPAR